MSLRVGEMLFVVVWERRENEDDDYAKRVQILARIVK